MWVFVFRFNWFFYDVDENRITAEYKDGVLKIDVMKTEVKPEDKPKKIDIK